MARFAGVKRRYQPTGTWNGATIYDDYGHHPVEIAAVLKAARAGARGGRVIAICEPHRYTRLRDLFADFAACFADADSVIIGPLYAAGEAPIPGVSHAALAAAITATGHADASHVDTPRALVPALKSRIAPGDTVLCLRRRQLHRLGPRPPHLARRMIALKPAKSHRCRSRAPRSTHAQIVEGALTTLNL